VKVTVSLLKPAVKSGVGLRIKTVFESDGQTVPVYTDALVVGTEEVEAGIIVVSGPTPTPRSRENALLKIVTGRVKGQLASGGIF
jgi:hypothetical protein